MKALALTLITAILPALPLFATPDRSVSITERFLGSSATHFALLRTEHDNLGSHYSGRSVTWLEEYEKQSTERKPTRQTLILDVTTSIDASFNGPQQLAPVSQTINQRDDSLPLSTVLERYPHSALQAWSETQSASIRLLSHHQITVRNMASLIDVGKMLPDTVGKRDPLIPAKIDLIAQDSNTVYLQLTYGSDEASETRIIHLPPALSKPALDQLNLEPLYLVAETHDTLEAATARLLELRKIATENGIYSTHPEIWSCVLPNGKIGYHIVESHTKHLIESGKIRSIEQTLGIRLTPAPSNHFIERFTP